MEETKKIRVSASIVTFNNINYIGTAVGTLLDSAKTTDLTVYVIDNGSTDGTIELLKSRFGKDPRFVLIETGKNVGFGAAHNRLLPLLDSDYHCIVNPDVIIKDDILDTMTSYAEAHRDVSQLSPRICFPDGRDQILGKRYPHAFYLVASRLRHGTRPGPVLSHYAMLNKGMDHPFEIDNATGCFMLFRTSDFKKAGGFDERFFMYFEDCDITRRMKSFGKVLYFPEAVVYHEWARDSKRNLKMKWIHISSMLKFYKKWRMI